MNRLDSSRVCVVVDDIEGGWAVFDEVCEWVGVYPPLHSIVMHPPVRSVLFMLHIADGPTLTVCIAVDAVLILCRLTNRLREQYLQSALRQEVAFYDTAATTGVLLQVLALVPACLLA